MGQGRGFFIARPVTDERAVAAGQGAVETKRGDTKVHFPFFSRLTAARVLEASLQTSVSERLSSRHE
jgi:hypothetical protein